MTDIPHETTPPQEVIRVQGLTRRFRDFWLRTRVTALKGIDFSVKQGEVFGLLGPNGSGKSTTIKILLGLLRPTSGSVTVLNQRPGAKAARARIGFLPEVSLLYPYLTPLEALQFYGSLFGHPVAQQKKAARDLLAEVGLEHGINRQIRELSKGMARRVGLAQVLLNDPDLIILDEPTSGLDPQGCRRVKDLVRELASRGKSIVLTSHLLSDVEEVCDRIGILHNGEMLSIGSIDELLTTRRSLMVQLDNPASPETIEALRTDLTKATQGNVTIEPAAVRLERFFLEVIEKQTQNSKSEN
jgi:ABC-2 type transport system ATP-binding protein